MSILRNVFKVATFPVVAMSFMPALSYTVANAQRYTSNVEWLSVATDIERQTLHGEWARLEVSVFELSATMVDELTNQYSLLRMIADYVVRTKL